MKVSKEKAAENRERILVEAARLFRERGLLGVGVDALTEAAGMTHGSLYSQFGSKENLAAEAMSFGYGRAEERAKAITSLDAAIGLYLSAAHRDNPGSGCFMAALGCDMARQSDPVRHSFTDIVRRNVTRIASLLPTHRKQNAEDEATARLATMVGAMILARGVDDPEFSDRILSVSRSWLLEQK